MKKLRYGYSTGTCAAAASKAALFALLYGERVDQVSITLPEGGQLTIPVQEVELQDGGAWAEVIKDGGDDLDVTHGLSIFARVDWHEEAEIIIEAGLGVGRVTKPGLAVPVGEPAINPIPREMIRRSVGELLASDRGLRVLIWVPEGEKTAGKTMNARLGILGGISILGTSGLVRPMSQEAFIDSLVPQIRQALALGHKILVLTPGGMGERMAAARGVHPESIVQTSNFIGAILEECREYQVEQVVLFGHIGKLVKVAGGIFNTHSRVADARREILAAHAALLGASPELTEAIMQLNTADESVKLLGDAGMMMVFEQIAEAVTGRCRVLTGGAMKIGTIIYALDGTILGTDQNAKEMGKLLAWNLT